MTVAVVFPGQGGHKRGMGLDLFEEFSDLVEEADTVLGYSLRQLCGQDLDGRLADTRYAQPAVYVVNALGYRRLLRDGGPHPDILLGHSLGEYNALEAAGFFGFADGLRVVNERARLMSRVSGTMTAVMGLPVEHVEAVLAAHPETRTEVSAVNSPRQIVVAGPRGPDGAEAAVAALRARGAVGATVLNVAGPFHTSHMAAAAAEFGDFLRRHATPPAALATPVVSTRTARPHTPGTVIRDLAAQIDHRLLWQQAVETVLDQDPDTEFREVGGAVLGPFTRQIRRRRATAARTGARR